MTPSPVPQRVCGNGNVVLQSLCLVDYQRNETYGFRRIAHDPQGDHEVRIAEFQGLHLAADRMRIITSLSNAIRFGMHNAVVCAEDLPFLEDADLSGLEATYMGSEQVMALRTICEHWPRGPMDEDFREPLRSSVPTLILSGEEDPITPPLYGDQVAQALPNSLHLIGAGQGHGIFDRGCLPNLLADFVQLGDLQPLDTSCVAKLAPSPFFVILNEVDLPAPFGPC